MKLKKMNTVIPVIACTSILLTAVSLSHELITSNKKEPVKKESAKKDPAILEITKEILEPVKLQSLRSHRFSRRSYTPPNIYKLVETHSSHEEGARFFDILVSAEPTKVIGLKIENVKQQANPTTKPKVKPKTYLKLKYLTASNKVLIQQNHEWVEKSEHKYLKLLPVTVDKK